MIRRKMQRVVPHNIFRVDKKLLEEKIQEWLNRLRK